MTTPEGEAEEKIESELESQGWREISSDEKRTGYSKYAHPMANDFTTIRISKDTKQRLEEHGRMNMSYDEVLQSVLDKLDETEDIE